MQSRKVMEEYEGELREVRASHAALERRISELTARNMVLEREIESVKALNAELAEDYEVLSRYAMAMENRNWLQRLFNVEVGL